MHVVVFRRSHELLRRRVVQLSVEPTVDGVDGVTQCWLLLAESSGSASQGGRAMFSLRRWVALHAGSQQWH